MEFLFFADLPVILHFELCHEYITNFIFVTFLADDLDVIGCMPGIRLPAEVYACLCRSDEQSITNLFITSNASHIASQIPYVNQRLLSKWLPEDTKKCMGSEIKSYFLAV